jgi:DNA-binding MarR family transcriptional regulator
MTPHDTRELATLFLELIPHMAREIGAGFRTSEMPLPPNQFILLRRLANAPMSQSDLADHLRVGASTVSATLDALEKRGWVKRERSETDRRVIHVAITAEGKALVDDAQESTLRRVEMMLGSVSDEDRAAMLNGLRAMRRMVISEAEAQLTEQLRKLREEGQLPPSMPPRDFFMPMPPFAHGHLPPPPPGFPPIPFDALPLIDPFDLPVPPPAAPDQDDVL